MYQFYFIVYKLLKSSNKLNLLSNTSVIISTVIASAILPLIFAIERGYENNILSRIIDFDGYARIYNEQTLSLTFSDNNYLFIEDNYVINNSNNSEAITFTAIKNFDQYFSNNFIIMNDLNKEGTYIGADLFKKLFLNNNLIQTFIFSKEGDIYPLKIKGIFKTNIPLYDKYMIISDISYYSKITNNQDVIVDGYIIKNKSDSFKLKSNTILYNEKYHEFISWLNSYKMPIYILVLFILIVMLINNSSSFYIDINNAKRDFLIYKTLGLSNLQIHIIYISKYVFLTTFSCIIGTIIYFLFFYIQTNFNIIKLSSEIYYSDTLLLFNSYKYCLYIPTILIIHSIYLYYRTKKDFYNVL